MADGTQQPTARNYFFGMMVSKGYRSKSPVEPRSLYLKQLEERLGKEAVENVTTEGQRKAVTDEKSELSRDRLVWAPINDGIGERNRNKK